MSVNTVANGELVQVAGNAFGIVDDELNAESTRPVQNKTVTEKFSEVEQSITAANDGIDAILDGTTPAGDAEKVGGVTKDSFMGHTNFKYIIVSDVNLNTITTEFHGYVRNVTNGPSNALTPYGWLDVSVIRLSAGDFNIRQVFTQVNNNEIFIRSFMPDTEWTSWTPLLTPSMVSNLNLLINPNCEIDQRGIGSYTGAGAVTFEPWLLGSRGDVGLVTKNSDGNIIFKSTSTAMGGIVNWYQKNILVKTGDIATYSFKYKSNSSHAYAVADIFSYTAEPLYIKLPKTDETWDTFIYTGIVGTLRNNVGLSLRAPTIYDEYIEVKDLKFEYGSVATSFVPPDPATELVKCQRYFYSGRASVCSFSFNTVASETYIPINFQFPVEMRTIPTVKVYSATSNEEGKVNNYLVGGDIANLVVSPNTIRSGSIFALKKTSGTFPSSGIGCVYFEADALT